VPSIGGIFIATFAVFGVQDNLMPSCGWGFLFQIPDDNLGKQKNSMTFQFK
jgi:hypothetical protein